MDLMLTTVLAFVIVAGIMLLVYTKVQTSLPSLGRLLRGSMSAPWGLFDFLTSLPWGLREDQRYLFTEQWVSSKRHSFGGRFDYAIMRYGEVRILDAVIERKFPMGRLPSKAKPEDAFQAGLYSLALMDSGVSCKSAKLIIMYCNQQNAFRCGRSTFPDCLNCSKPRIFLKQFKSDEVVHALHRLDEVWKGVRPPRPCPERTKCSGCPFGGLGQCRYSVAQQKAHLGLCFHLGHA